MNRRNLVKGMIGSGVVVALGGQSAFAQTPEAEQDGLFVESRWETTNLGNDRIDMFETKITAMKDEQEPLDILVKFDEDAKEGNVRGKRLGMDRSESTDSKQYWQAVFVEYSNPYMTTQRALAHCGNLFFSFRWEHSQWSSGTDAYRVFRSVMNRAESTHDLEELGLLLPTQQEFDVIGTYEQVV